MEVYGFLIATAMAAGSVDEGREGVPGRRVGGGTRHTQAEQVLPRSQAKAACFYGAFNQIWQNHVNPKVQCGTGI